MHVRRARRGDSEKCAPRSRTAVWVTTKLRLKAARLAMADAIPGPEPDPVAVRPFASSEAKPNEGRISVLSPIRDCDSVFAVSVATPQVWPLWRFVSIQIC